ncbi:MAG: SAM-dependent methyltransferase [Pseudomonadota bacterium]
MTPLARIIAEQIAATGPISVAEYMRLCLGHPQHGYYTTRDPLGEAGDFTTAPEISQMFGEMIGLWIASQWHEGTRLVELGPGRGTLMADALRVLRGADMAPEVWFVETSPVLREAQAGRVGDARWATMLDQVPDGPLIAIANEFFDALPVREYLETPQGWRERQVGLIEDKLGFGLSSPLPLRPEAPGWWAQSVEADAILAEIANRLRADGGAALIIDYGYASADRPAGPTLQALRSHAPQDPLEAPGETDLTWLQDFDHMRKLLCGLHTRVSGQGAFLAAMGIGQRAAKLAAATPGAADTLADALERLTAPEQMGTLFKVLAVSATDRPMPGF